VRRRGGKRERGRRFFLLFFFFTFSLNSHPLSQLSLSNFKTPPNAQNSEKRAAELDRVRQHLEDCKKVRKDRSKEQKAEAAKAAAAAGRGGEGASNVV